MSDKINPDESLTTMTKCPDCKKDVSIHASSCPNCGRPLEPAIRTDIKPVNMGFSLLALPIIITLSSWGSVKEYGFWSVSSLFIFIFAVFIGIEAYRNRKIKNIGNPFFWFIGALFFYPIIYPYYMFKRKEIRLDSVFKWVSIPLALLTAYFWFESYNAPRFVNVSSSSSFSESTYTSEPAQDSASYERKVCEKTKVALNEYFAMLKGSKAPSCTSVTIVKKVSKESWIGRATASNGKSGEINIVIIDIGGDPTVTATPVEYDDF